MSRKKSKITLVIKASDIKPAMGHRSHTTGSGAHDNRPKRQRTRSEQNRKAIQEYAWWSVRLLERLSLWLCGHILSVLFMLLWRQDNGWVFYGRVGCNYLWGIAGKSLIRGWLWPKICPRRNCRKPFDSKDLRLFWFFFGFSSWLPLTCADKYNILIRRLECCIYWLPRVRLGWLGLKFLTDLFWKMWNKGWQTGHCML